MGRFFCICLAEIQMSNIIVTCEDTMGKCKSFIAESHAAAADMIPVHTAIVHSLLVLSVGRSTKEDLVGIDGEVDVTTPIKLEVVEGAFKTFV